MLDESGIVATPTSWPDAFTSKITATPTRPRYMPSNAGVVCAYDDVVHVSDKPGHSDHGHVADEEHHKGAHDEKWIDRPICRLPGSFGYHLKRFVNAGDIEGPVRIASGPE